MASIKIDPNKPARDQFLELVARTTRTHHPNAHITLGAPARAMSDDPAETMIRISVRADQYQNDRVVRYQRIFLNEAFLFQRLEVEGDETTTPAVLVDRFNSLGYTQLIEDQLVFSAITPTAKPDMYRVTITAKHDSLLYTGSVKVYLNGVPNVLQIEHDRIDRFTPKYWRLDGPRTMSLALTTTDTSMEAFFIARKTSDLCGVIWDSKDTKDHQLLGYEHNTNYQSCVWEFDVEVSDTMAEISDPIKGLVMTVYGLDEFGFGYEWYVALRHYATMVGPRKARIRLDWDNVKGGFNADETINLEKIETIFFSGVASSYDAEGPSTPLAEPAVCWIRVINQTVSGTGAQLTRQRVIVNDHPIGMCTSYDDHYDLSPQRIIENCHALGYRGWINHYVGMSTYPNREWHAGEMRFRTNGTQPALNEASRKWHADFAKYCKQYGYELMQSVSYELFSEFCPYEWTQRDWNDNYAATGWSPPSYLMSPCVVDAMTWMKKAFVEFSAIADAAGLDVIMQVGEPWWWWNGSTSKPCIYDYQTRLAFNAATGLFAPEFPTITSTLTGTPYDEYKQFLSRTLGESVLSMCSAVKAVYPNAKTTTLFFLPSIITPDVGIMQEINYPKVQYSQANLDFFMTEAYDWLITAQVLRAEDSLKLPINDLGYSADRLQYLAGFVPDASMAELLKFDPNGPYRQEIWQRIFGNMRNNLAYTGLRQYVWSYPQVMHDSITYLNEDNLNHFFSGQVRWAAVRDDRPYNSSDGDPESPGHGNTGGTVGNGEYLPARPSNLHCLRNSWGDVTVSWDLIDDKVTSPQFLLELFALESSTVLKSINTTQKTATIDRNEIQYLYGEVPTQLRYRVRRVGGPSSQITSQALEYDPSEQKASDPKALINNWGDFYLSWEGPVTGRYLIEIFDAGNRVGQKVAVNATEYVLTAEDASAMFLRNVTFLEWRVGLVDDQDLPLSGPSNKYAAVPVEDNTKPVVVALLGINSLIGGYFNDLSDYSNPGGSGRPGRKDSVAASTFRKRMAQEMGLNYWDVMPVMTVVGSSPINPMPYQEGFPATNYWWDASANGPGPNLVIADDIVKAIGRVPDFFVESGPGETTGIAFAAEDQRPAILAAWRTSNMAMLAWMRANWGNPTMNIWFQGATTSWWGAEEPPREVNFTGAKLLRDLQTSMSLENIGFKMGSYVPNGGSYETFYNEQAVGMGWVHYTPDGYHNAAREMAEAIAKDINRAENPPLWTTLVPPTGLKALKRTDKAIRYSWDGGQTNYTLEIMHPQSGAIVRTVSLTDSFYVLSVEDQVTLFGFEASYAHFMVAQSYPDIGNGPFAEYEGGTDDTTLQQPQNLTVTKRLNGDVAFVWDQRDTVKYFVRNFKIAEGNPVIFEGEVTGSQYIFTREVQEATYGSDVIYVRADIYEYDPVNQTVGPVAYWNGDATREGPELVAPTNLAAIRHHNEDILISWESEQTQFRLQLFNPGDGTLLVTHVVDGKEYLLTAQEQRDLMVYTFGYLQCEVAEKVGEVVGPTAQYANTVPNQPPAVQNPTNGTFERNGAMDVTYGWDALDGEQWRVEIIHAGNGSIVDTRVVSVPSTIFTEQQQRDTYGFYANYHSFYVTALKPSVSAESDRIQFTHEFT